MLIHVKALFLTRQNGTSLFLDLRILFGGFPHSFDAAAEPGRPKTYARSSILIDDCL